MRSTTRTLTTWIRQPLTSWRARCCPVSAHDRNDKHVVSVTKLVHLPADGSFLLSMQQLLPVQPGMHKSRTYFGGTCAPTLVQILPRLCCRPAGSGTTCPCTERRQAAQIFGKHCEALEDWRCCDSERSSGDA